VSSSDGDTDYYIIAGKLLDSYFQTKDENENCHTGDPIEHTGFSSTGLLTQGTMYTQRYI
jgi:hypothetical protein